MVAGLMRTARFLGWREFVIAFLLMAVGTSLPNLFVGISSARQGIPHLSLGDALGNNLVVLTAAVALGVLLSAKKEISTNSRTVQTTALYMVGASILPLLLISDGILNRSDGLILIGFFVFYISWLFSKKERFASRECENHDLASLSLGVKQFLKDLLKIAIGIGFLVLAARGIIQAASFFAEELNAPLMLIGILIVGLGNALPEVYFVIAAARKNDTWLILGNLMGSVVILSTLVLGVVSLIHPIYILNDFGNWEILALSRIFVVLAAILFFIFSRLDRKITAKESCILLAIYVIFVTSAVWFLN